MLPLKAYSQKKNVLTAGRYQTFCGESDPLLQSLLPVSFQAGEMLCLQGPCREGMGCSGVQKGGGVGIAGRFALLGVQMAELGFPS